MPKILGVGNALLDLNLAVERDYLERHGLPLNTSLLVQNNNHQQVFREVLANPATQITTGGCCANTLKFIQAISDVHRLAVQTTFLGRIGRDPFGQTYQELLQNEIMNTHFLTSTLPSGKVAALSNSENRCLLADLGAVTEPIQEFPPSRLFQPLTQFDILYVPGMFVASSGTQIIEHFQAAKSDDAIVATNLSGTFIMEDEASLRFLIRAVQLSDIVFGNDEEWAMFEEKSAGVDMGMQDKLRIVTRGGKDTTFSILGRQEVVEAIKRIENGDIVDTTGAGDAFAAGFLAKYICERQKCHLNSVSSNASGEDSEDAGSANDCDFDQKIISDAVKFGHEIAWNCIQNVGATIAI